MAAMWWLFPIGVVIGGFGTLIGAGGGFLLVPLLLILYPAESPEIITSISLAVVFFNAASGTWAYARMGRVKFRAALLFSIATVPGAIFGALTTNAVPRHLFDLILGMLMLVVAIHLWRDARTPDDSMDESRGMADLDSDMGPQAKSSYDPPRTKLGMALSAVVGYVSSLLGIGGGIIHVPLLVRVLRFPVHTATATSHFILAVIALVGTIVHISTGTFYHGWRRTIVLGLGVIVGAQVGAALSSRVRGSLIIRALAVALAFVSIRILMLAMAAP